MTTPPEAAEGIATALSQSRKWRDICPATLLRTARWALARYPAKAALKNAKRKLHQVCGACLEEIDSQPVRGFLKAVAEASPGAADRALSPGAADRALSPGVVDRVLSPGALNALEGCERVLAAHPSTRERLPFFADFLVSVLRKVTTGPPGASVLDLACGFFPFGLGMIQKASGGAPEPFLRDYAAWDVHERLIEAVNAFLPLVGLAPRAECRDVLCDMGRAWDLSRGRDLTLLLKILPALEQQEKGSSMRLIARLESRYLLVSFPSQSLAGQRKGMRKHYDDFFTSLSLALDLATERFDFPSETFYLVHRRRATVSIDIPAGTV